MEPSVQGRFVFYLVILYKAGASVSENRPPAKRPHPRPFNLQAFYLCAPLQQPGQAGYDEQKDGIGQQIRKDAGSDKGVDRARRIRQMFRVMVVEGQSGYKQSETPIGNKILPNVFSR